MPRFFQLAEDQENVACGFWPGNLNYAGVTLGEPAFYAYIYPEPEGFKEASVRPATAHYDPRLGEFILPYEDVRRAAAPGQALLEFFQSTYAAAADLAGWNRQLLCGTVELALVTSVLAGVPAALPPACVIASMVVRSALGTGVVYILNYGLIRDAGTARRSASVEREKQRERRPKRQIVAHFGISPYYRVSSFSHSPRSDSH